MPLLFLSYIDAEVARQHRASLAAPYHGSIHRELTVTWLCKFWKGPGGSGSGRLGQSLTNKRSVGDVDTPKSWSKEGSAALDLWQPEDLSKGDTKDYV